MTNAVVAKVRARARRRPPAPAAGPRRPGIAGDRELWWVVGAVLVFFAVTIWWLTQDNRVPDFDSGLHTVQAFAAHDDIAGGDLTAPFERFNTYPPLVHLLGGLATFVVGAHPWTMIVMQNVVFLPLLAISCYGVGRMVYGPRGGFLAAIFVLGTPIVVSEMREFYLDLPQAAMVAACVWALLASQRFEVVRLAALAGVLGGLAMLTKQTSVFFVAGPILVVVARGGWRHPRGLLAFAVALLVVALPWYLYHLAELREYARVQGSLDDGLGNRPGGQYPDLDTAKNWFWYFWDFVNMQARAPLALAFFVGLGLAVRSIVRDRSPANLKPELVGGVVFSYVAMTLVHHKDIRYTIPALVFVAVIGAGWIAEVHGPRLRLALSTLLVAVCTLNFLGVSFGLGREIKVALPKACPTCPSPLYERQLRIFATDGWLRSQPDRNGDVLGMLRGLRRLGYDAVAVDGAAADSPDFNGSGIQAFARIAGLGVLTLADPATIPDGAVYLRRRFFGPGAPAPCDRLDDGSSIYAILDNASLPPERWTLVCPFRRPPLYGHSANGAAQRKTQ